MGKKILMICYYYPPVMDVGSKRSVAFSKYWHKAGWEPHVLSVKNPDTGYCTVGDGKPPENIEVTYARSLFNVYRLFGKINGLISRALRPIGIKVKRNYFYDFLCIPDIFIGWIPLAIVSGIKIIKEKDIDLIYVSCSPYSAGLIGVLLKKFTGKPLIVDYRDAFGVDISKHIDNGVANRYTASLKQPRFRKSIDNRIARLVLGSCNLFTVTTKESEETYIDHFQFLSNKIHTIYNGFDHQLLEGVTGQEKYRKFTITYAGNFYYEIEFEYFFEALKILKKRGTIHSDNFQFLFYGGAESRLQDLLIRHDINELVHIKPRVSHLEVLNIVKCSHLQLLRIIKPMISTKLFEGVALDVPFLATIPEGEGERIIKRYSPSSLIVSDNCPETVADSIQMAMQRYQEHAVEANLVEDFLQYFSRENQAHKYTQLMAGIEYQQPSTVKD